MRIGILGTGIVGRTLGSRLVGLGHDVTMGSRTADNDAARQWVTDSGGSAAQGDFAAAAAAAEVVVNATGGMVSLEALAKAGDAALDGKVLMDVANPLDFSRGRPPSLGYGNGTSLGEEIQKAHPGARVVKALNTMHSAVMVDPSQVPAPHEVFVGGNDAAAKAIVAGLLGEFGWPEASIIDLGSISASRGLEAYVLFWVQLRTSLPAGPAFNIHVSRPAV